MRKLFPIFVILFSFSKGLAQYCSAVGPSSTNDSNIQSILLNGVSGTITYTGCPGVAGLQDLTSQSVLLDAGGSYTISIQFGTCGGNYNGAGTAWIDFNQDGNFDQSEVLGVWAGIPPTSLSTFNFIAPLSAQNGSTRLRVTQQESGSLPLDPCATFTWGSVIDFTIIIQNGIDCSSFPGDDKLDAIAIPSFPFTDSRDNSYCYSNQNLVYSSPDIFYKFTPTPNMAQVTASLCGSSFDTFLSVIDTAGNVIAYNDDFGACGSNSQVTFSTLNVGPMFIIVEGWGTASGPFTINLTTSTLNEVEKSLDAIQLFPNPAASSVRISGYEGKIEIADFKGDILKSVQVQAGDEIDLSELSNGIYILSFSQNYTSLAKKLIVRK